MSSPKHWMIGSILGRNKHGDFPSSGSNSSITFVGTSGYLADGPTVTLDAAEVANRSSTYTSGSLRLEGWLFSTPYQGGSQSGYEVAIAPIESTTDGTLSPDAIYSNISYTVPLTGSAPPATYYPALLLGEYTGQSASRRGVSDR